MLVARLNESSQHLFGVNDEHHEWTENRYRQITELAEDSFQKSRRRLESTYVISFISANRLN
jgi:hypothetical protein